MQEQGCVVPELADGGCDAGVAGLAEEPGGEVTEGGQDAGAGAGPDPGGVLPEGDVADLLRE